MRVSNPRLVIIADDLSGAAETAGAIAAASGSPAQVWLGHPGGFDAPVVAVDTATRALTGEAVGAALAATLDAIPHGARVYKKIDSLLRGHVAAELAVLRARGLQLVVAMAVPRIGRSVRDGVVTVSSVPLHESRLWGSGGGHPPRSIADAIGLPCAALPLDVVRSERLASALTVALAAGQVPVCDSETEADLDRIAEALRGLDPRVVVVGSAGLARSMAAGLDIPSSVPRFTHGSARVITVVGSVAATAPAQVARLVARGVAQVVLSPGAPIELDGHDAVVTLAADMPWDDATFAALAGAVARLPGRTDLVLTGGDTARRTLDALGVTCLFPEREIHDGAVLSTTADGAAVVTRPGSYGSDDSLVQIVDHLKGHL